MHSIYAGILYNTLMTGVKSIRTNTVPQRPVNNANKTHYLTGNDLFM